MARSVPSTETVPDVGASRPPARVSRVDLPEPDGPITATSSPACAAKDTALSACTSVSPSPWMRVTVSSCSTAVMGGAVIVRFLSRAGRSVAVVRCRVGRLDGGAAEPGLAVVEPADLGLGAEDQRVEDQAPGQVARRRVGAVALEPGVVLERGHGRAALLLDDGADVDAGHGDGQRELDGELVARRRGPADRRGEPGRAPRRGRRRSPRRRRGPRRRRRTRPAGRPGRRARGGSGSCRPARR